MARSDLGLTTWSKLKKQTNESPLKRYAINHKKQKIQNVNFNSILLIFNNLYILDIHLEIIMKTLLNKPTQPK